MTEKELDALIASNNFHFLITSKALALVSRLMKEKDDLQNEIAEYKRQIQYYEDN